MTPQLLLEAYQKSTGLKVSMSYSREMTLTTIVQLGITPEELEAVANKLKTLIRQKPNVYTPDCLSFRNLCDPDKLEERVLALRQEQARKAPKKPQVERETVNGFKVLDSPKEKDPGLLDVKGSLLNIVNNLPRTA